MCSTEENLQKNINYLFTLNPKFGHAYPNPCILEPKSTMDNEPTHDLI